MSGWSAYRCLMLAAVLGSVAVFLAGTASAGTAEVSVKVTPNHGLVNGQLVTVSGHGIPHSGSGTNLTWFITECTASVRGRMNPSTDTPYCDVTDAQAIRVGHNGSFSAKFRVRAGIVGDGYCGTAGHSGCVLSVGNARGQGAVVRITFATTAASTTTTTSTTAA